MYFSLYFQCGQNGGASLPTHFGNMWSHVGGVPGSCPSSDVFKVITDNDDDEDVGQYHSGSPSHPLPQAYQSPFSSVVPTGSTMVSKACLVMISTCRNSGRSSL